MAELTTLARPYAKAAFEFAQAANQLQSWYEALEVSAAVAAQEQVKKALAASSLSAQQKASIFVQVCGDQLDEKQQNFIRTLASNKRLALLPYIKELFARMKAQQEKTIDVEVTAAYELPVDLINKLAQALSAKLDRNVSVHSSVDRSLLGGAVVHTGDTVIDGSVRGRLAKLAEALKS
jgi:F-type H+-transporting ATPase subunit delta